MGVNCPKEADEQQYERAGANRGGELDSFLGLHV